MAAAVHIEGHGLVSRGGIGHVVFSLEITIRNTMSRPLVKPAAHQEASCIGRAIVGNWVTFWRARYIRRARPGLDGPGFRASDTFPFDETVSATTAEIYRFAQLVKNRKGFLACRRQKWRESRMFLPAIPDRL
jgi:hypothetical protein